MEVESGQVGRISRNRNGTYDMGPMQINSFWLPRLKALGITEGAVTDHGCVNLAVGAWLLRSHLKRTGRLDRAVSDYHSLNPELGKKYLLAAKARAKNLDPSKTILRANGFLK
jgi:hypothetical protein